MNESAYSDIIFQLQLTAIELLSLNIYDTPQLNEILTFNFNLGVESKVNPTDKLIFVITTVEIKNDDSTISLGQIKLSCIFKLENFEEYIKTTPSGKFELNQALVNTLNMVSISTTRGFMFASFKGTILHNAILPIVDPLKINPITIHEKSKTD